VLERLSWKRLAFELVMCCLPALLLGAIFGYWAWFLLLAVTGLLVWHFWNLMRLSWWIWVDRSMTPPTDGRTGKLGSAAVRPASNANAQ